MEERKNKHTAMAAENYKATTWESLEESLVELADLFGNDYYLRALERVNRTFDHNRYKGNAVAYDYQFYNAMKEAILSLVLEDVRIYPFVADNAPFTDSDKVINPSYDPQGDFHDAFSVVDNRYVGIEFKCRNSLDELTSFKDKDGNSPMGISIVGKMYEETIKPSKDSIILNNKYYHYKGKPYKLGGVTGCSLQTIMQNKMYHFQDRLNLVARNYVDYYRYCNSDKPYEIDGILDNITYGFNKDMEIIETHNVEHFKLLDCFHPAFHLVFHVKNHIYIYNMNYMSSDFTNGYIRKRIAFKPVSTQMKQGVAPHDVFDIPLDLVDHYVIENGEIVEMNLRDPKLIIEELITLPMIVDEVPNDIDSRLEWNWKNLPIANDDEIKAAQEMHGGSNIDIVELSYDEMITLANAELISI
jgi:hypothetical protein